MTKKTLSMLLVIAMLLIAVVPQAINGGGVAAAAPEGYRRLQDIQIFNGSRVEGWSGSGGEELETVNGTLPVDTKVTYNGIPTLRLNVQVPLSTAWWISLITLRGWNTHDLSEYVDNGYLEFYIKGKDGGEDFLIGFRDKVYERSQGLEIDVDVMASKYVNITTEWQHVRIPMKDLIFTAGGFDPSNATCLVFNKKNGSAFTVWFSDIKITSDDNEKSAPAIKVNQLGFIPDSEKYALITGFKEDLAVEAGEKFFVVDASNEKVAYTGDLELVTEYEPIDSGEKILKADFSNLAAAGEYYIKIDGLDNSPRFAIGKGIYNPLLVDSARYFYYQRQGIELEEKYAGEYARKDMTPQDKEAVFSTGKMAPVDVSKGWYDAGDFGKYVNAGSGGVSDLFWAYEMFPEQFTDNQLNIPESGNGIPDILDEARWEIEWILKMQDTDSGGFYPRIQSDDDENVTSRIIRNQNGCTTDDTACAAAILAHAYLMYMEYDSDFAQNCLDAAKDAWVFLQNNPRDIVSPSGPYNVDDDRADRLWAAASLYRVTGEEIYNTYFKENYKSFAKRFEDPDEYAHTWGDMWLTAFLSYLKADNKDAEAKSWIDAKFDIWLDNVLSRAESNPWQNAIVPGNYFWGINMQVMNVPMDAIIGSKLLDKYTDRVSKLGFSSLSWLLGANPLRFSFVSGYGENSVKGIYSNIYNSDGKEGIPNGYMPGGPNAYEGAGLSRFAAKCYTKSTGDWVANEHTVYWNSALVFMSAYASQKAGSIVEPTPKPTEKPTPNPTPTTPNEGTNEVDVNINTGSGRRAISPYIYGSNQDVEATLTAKRFGGNRTTAYNWETNFSNAGNDWVHSSDTWLCEDAGVPKGRWSEPGAVVTTFHDKALENNVDYSIITLQAAGYVSADADGAVSEEEKAPSPRWKEVVFEKGAPFSLTPDTDDDYVYMDEFVNFLVNKYGNASEPTGVKGYSVDNEPALWTSTHSRMHPEKVTCEEIINKTVDLSKAVKNVDPYAEIFGPALYGFAAFESLQSAPDWDEKEEDYRWFIDYYLDSMKKAADRENRRLLDVLDVHWYPEAQGGGARICFGEDQRNIECNKARLQAARTLWDPTYYENSWIGDHKRDSLPILPSLFDSIESYYPGTKLAITEYDYGAGKHITGGIAQADVLGIFGEYGVYLATYWGEPSNNFTASGINLYTNYDGQGGTFGDTSVECEVSDNELGSAYASIIGEDDGKLHIIVLNKNYDESTTFNFKIDSETNYKTGEVWAFDRGSSNITKRMPVAGISENAFTYTLPALTACHIILDTEQSFIYGDIDNNGAVDAVDLVLLKRYLFGYISNINEEAADICLDGSIDSNDYALLKKWLLKNIRQLPSIPENNKPVANFTISKAEATTDDTIQFDASTSVDPDQNIAFYVWDFGNGLEATGKLVGFKYMNPGEYTVKLTVTDTRGASDTLTKTVAVISATGDNSKFSFEDGTDGGFATDGTETSTIANSNVRAFRGLSSLRWDINSSGEGEALLIMDGDNMVAPGETIVYRIWVPEDAQIGAIQPYIMPHTSDWEESFWNSTWGGYSSLEKEAWNEFTLTLPEDTDPSLPQQLGIQIMTSGEGEFTVFVDSIDW